ncbi:MAG: hypothetical protein WDN76_10255 [Alphaproteobacteria bacterium]
MAEENPAQEKARKRRNAVIAGALLAFVVLVFFITIAKMKAGG